MLSHLARNVCSDDMSILELYSEHRVWEGLDHGSLHLNVIFFGQAGLSSKQLREGIVLENFATCKAILRDGARREKQEPIAPEG